MRLKVTIGGSVLGLATLVVNPAWAQGPGAGPDTGTEHAGVSTRLHNTLMRVFSGADSGTFGSLRLPHREIAEQEPVPAADAAEEPRPLGEGLLPALKASTAKIRSGMQLLVDTVSTVGFAEIDRERVSEWDMPREPRRRYALTPQVGEDSRLILNKGLVGFRHRLDEKVDFGATFGESYELADPEHKAIKVQLNLKF